MGGIFRNFMGIVFFAYSAPLARIFGSLMAETLATLRDTKKAITGGIVKVLIQIVCEVVVKLLRAKKVPSTDVSFLIVDILCPLDNFVWCEFMFMSEVWNMVAHNSLLIDIDICWSFYLPLATDMPNEN